MPGDRAPTLPTEVRRGRVRETGWVRVGRGLFHPADIEDGVLAGLAAWQQVLPARAAFTHLSGARARGWWLPPMPDDLPTFVVARRGDGSTKRPELRWCRLGVTPEHDVVGGVRVATAAETLLACARDVSLLDLVVLVDGALHAAACSRDDLADLAARQRRGAVLLRRAIELADGRAESPYESLLRVLHVVCGIDVEPQHELLDEHGGFLARGDLWLTGTRTFHEYDGGDHLGRARQAKDLRRVRRIDGHDWTRRGYTSADVLRRAVTILRDADASLGREHRPERVRAWNALLRDSLFTPAGQSRLRRRLGLPVPAPGSGNGGVATGSGEPGMS